MLSNVCYEELCDESGNKFPTFQYLHIILLQYRVNRSLHILSYSNPLPHAQASRPPMGLGLRKWTQMIVSPWYSWPFKSVWRKRPSVTSSTYSSSSKPLTNQVCTSHSHTLTYYTTVSLPSPWCLQIQTVALTSRTGGCSSWPQEWWSLATVSFSTTSRPTYAAVPSTPSQRKANLPSSACR